MGLDQYLYAEKYVGADMTQQDGQRKLDNTNIVAVATAAGLEGFLTPQRSWAGVTVQVTAAYWRKANAVHNWFVNNVQGGTDDCGEYEVSLEQLAELRDACVKAIGMYERGEPGVEDVMTPLQGFFFGNTDIDEWYLADLKSTVEQLDRVLGLPQGEGFGRITFKYQSSW